MDEYYWGLPSLARFIRWLEELVAILSKPFLMVGFIISMLDLLTQGRLLDDWLIFYGWAAIQAIAVDACFFVTWHKAKKAFLSSRWISFGGYTLLGVALGIVAWAAMDLQSLEQAVGISNVEALARLNLNPVLLTHLRSLVAVVMGGVVAMIAPEDNVNTKPGKPLNSGRWKWVAWIGKRLHTVQPVVTPPSAPPIERPALKIERSKVLTNLATLASVEQVVNTEQSVVVPNSQPVKQVVAEHLTPINLAAVEQFVTWPEPHQAPEKDGYSFVEFPTVVARATLLPSAVKPVAELASGSALVEPATKKATNTDKKKTSTKGRQVEVVEEVPPEQRVRLAYSEHGPVISHRRLATLANVSPATAGKWKEIIEQEKRAVAL